MKKSLLGVASLATLLSGPALADDVELSANMAIVTDYVFRGISQTDNTPAIQGGIDATYGGFYAGTWASNIDENTYAGSNMEWDFYLGYGGEIGGFGYDVGFLAYRYPGVTNDANNTEEWHAGVSYDFGVASVGYTLNYSDDFYGLQDAIYHDLSLDVPLPEEFGLSLHYGSTDYDNDVLGDDYEDWSIGLSKSYGGFDFGLTFTGTSSLAPNTTATDDDKVVLSVGKSF